LPELVGGPAAAAQSGCRKARLNTLQAAKETAMNEERPDPNTDLATREPLRTVFALAALLLGLIAALH
jgi:hypothetical protein